MKQLLTVLTPPAAEPVTLELVKAFLRIDHDVEDELLHIIIAAARNYIERYTGRSLVTRVLELRLFADLRDSKIILPYGPVKEVSKVKLSPLTGETETINANNYLITISQGLDCLKFRSTLHLKDEHTLIVTYSAGYSHNPQHLPPDLRYALLMLAANFYRAQTLADDIAADITRLITPYKFLSINAEIPPYPLHSLLD